jgi:hypothetical protein
MARLIDVTTIRECWRALDQKCGGQKWIPVGAVVSSALVFKWLSSMAKRRQLALKVKERQAERQESFKRLRNQLLVNGEVL